MQLDFWVYVLLGFGLSAILFGLWILYVIIIGPIIRYFRGRKNHGHALE